MDHILSGIKPTGQLTLGNYIGAIKNFAKVQNEGEAFLFIADLHALTIHQNPEELRENTENLIAIYLAAGLDRDKVYIFKQSDVPAHNQLEWILTCNTQLPELTKMPQYKNFAEKHKNEAMPTGMLMYPSLMNADILLYDADYVPVGIDQKPHVDLTRDIAERFNKLYGTDNSKVKEEIDNKWNELIENAKDESEREELEGKKEKELEKRLQIIEKEKTEYIEDMMRMIESMYDSSASLDLIQYVDNDFINKVFDILRKLNY